MENTKLKLAGPNGSRTLEVSFDQVSSIAAFLNSIRTADDRTLRLRMGELEKTEMGESDWNTFGIAARVILYGHPAHDQVLSVVHKNIGQWDE